MRLILACVFFGCGFASLAQAEMSAVDIKSRFVGAEISWWELSGERSGALVLHPDGTAMISVGKPEAASDDGYWSIDGNMLCTQWAALRDSKKCYSISPVGTDAYVTSGGNGFKIVYTGV